jgi:hypothetical protein
MCCFTIGSNSSAAWVDEAGMAPRDADRKRFRTPAGRRNPSIGEPAQHLLPGRQWRDHAAKGFLRHDLR